MDANRVARLTEQQRACLRFVASGMTSKEIAPLLGIEPGSVDQHLKAAMRVLGVGDRRNAARLLARHEGEPPQKLVYQPRPVVPPADPSILALSTDTSQQRQGVSGRFLHEAQAPFEPISSAVVRGPALPLPVWGTKPHHLNWVKRLAWIAAGAIGTALAFGGLVSAIETLVRLRAG
ncbi:MAG TPA: helix-turn-helix transcriptional regulator [Allosphingosinicella sp.]|nr:helix-turn-helix transcriptional regulator [Allosphingosinicella sp.]